MADFRYTWTPVVKYADMVAGTEVNFPVTLNICDLPVVIVNQGTGVSVSTRPSSGQLYPRGDK